MACFKPIEAWQSGEKHPISGRRMPTLRSSEARKDLPRVGLPCGQCLGCRADRALDWKTRLTHESKLHADSSFLTFTYADEHRHADRSLHLEDLQKCIKRIRRRREGEKLRYFAVGEYGEHSFREHWHMLAFGLRIDDRRAVAGKPGEFTSAFLDDVWGLGAVYGGSVTPESIGYCSGYMIEKRTGPLAEAHYAWTDPDTGEVHHRRPEFAVMSTNPAIGRGAFERWSSEFYDRDFVAQRGGGKVAVPAYYDRLLTREDPELMESIKVARLERAADPKAVANSTPERLAVREEVARARRKTFRKSTL